jgi:hypothetical protein
MIVCLLIYSLTLALIWKSVLSDSAVVFRILDTELGCLVWFVQLNDEEMTFTRRGFIIERELKELGHSRSMKCFEIVVLNSSYLGVNLATSR